MSGAPRNLQRKTPIKRSLRSLAFNGLQELVNSSPHSSLTISNIWHIQKQRDQQN